MGKKDKTPKTLEEALIDLYLNIENMNTEMMNDEKENLKKTNPLTLIEYIKSSIDILIDLKVDEKLEIFKKEMEETGEDKQNEYEVLLRKLENDIRQHIRMEHQLKLHSESLQFRVEELEKENEDFSYKNKLINEKNENKEIKKDPEVNVLKNEIVSLKQILKSYEDQSVKLSDLEKKLRNQNSKYEKEMKSLEENYKEKIKHFSKKLASYEEMMKNNNSFRSSRRDEEVDRINFIDFSHETSKSPVTSRKSPIVTERKKDTDTVKDKIEHYRKIIDKKINIISQSNINKTLNKSGLTGNDERHDRSSSNNSIMTKDMSDTSKSFRKNDALMKNLDIQTKKLLTKDSNFKTHFRNQSMEVTGKNNNSKSPLNIAKNIHAMKEMLFNQNKNNVPKNSSKIIQKIPNVNNPTSNIILNQGGNQPCYNQITIYTSNNPVSNNKPNEINLRQYIFNKVAAKPKSISKLGHSRTQSMNIIN